MYHTVQHSCCSLPLVDSLAFPLQKINGLKPSSSLSLTLGRGYTCTCVVNQCDVCILQKWAVRAIANSDYQEHTASLFAKLGICIANSQIYQKQLLPPMFPSLFSTSSQMHSYDTRTVKSYRPHHCCTILKQFTILYQGPKIWNSLPISSTGSTSFSSPVSSNVGLQPCDITHSIYT